VGFGERRQQGGKEESLHICNSTTAIETEEETNRKSGDLQASHRKLCGEPQHKGLLYLQNSISDFGSIV
jgi:hypothetical protein